MRFLVVALTLVWIASSGLAGQTARVVVVCDAIEPNTQAEIVKHLGPGFQVVAASVGDGVDSSAALALVEKVPAGGAEVLLLGVGEWDLKKQVPLHDYLTNLEKIVKAARERSLAVIWSGFASEQGDAYRKSAAKLMAEAGAVMADYPGFLMSFPPTTPASRMLDFKAEFFAEAIGQWWAVLAAGNREYVRERLWLNETPPEFLDVGPVRLNNRGRVDHVSVPEITSLTTGGRTAVIVFPGGGYGFLGFLRNARELAGILGPQGVRVFALTYRTGRGAEVPLHDARRAVKWVRAHAGTLGVDPDRIGVAGISAGANLALNLASRWSPGDSQSGDPIERVSSRPDFVAVFSVWNFGSTESPFTFQADAPPVFLRHARNDKGFALGERVVQQLQEAKVPVDYLFLDEGGHGAFDFAPGNPGTNWPADFLVWLQKLGLWEKPSR